MCVVAGADLFGLALLRGGVFVERPGALQQLVGLVVGPLRPGGRCSGGCLRRPSCSFVWLALFLERLVWLGLGEAVLPVVDTGAFPLTLKP